MTEAISGQFVPSSALDAVLPMHLLLTDDGIIRHVAPTIQKVAPATGLSGQAFLDVFRIDRPLGLSDTKSVSTLVDVRLRLVFKDCSRTSLKSRVIPLGKGKGYLVDLSFGISVVNAVADYGLSSADFAPNDTTVEMLYLTEANAAAMKEAQRLVLRLQAARQTAENASLTDGLTGLKNRRALEAEVGTLVRQRKMFGLLQIDLDFFKAVNDTHGHAAGDAVLQCAASRIKNAARDVDFPARIGGDEFVLLVTECDNAEVLVSIAERIIRSIEKPINFGGIECRISASVGVTVSSDYETATLEQMMLDADHALYAAKNEGRGRAIFAGPSAQRRGEAVASEDMKASR